MSKKPQDEPYYEPDEGEPSLQEEVAEKGRKKDPTAVARGKQGGRPEGWRKRLFTYADIARVFDVREETVRRWFADGGALASGRLEDFLDFYVQKVLIR